jgi:hypothetical protein
VPLDPTTGLVKQVPSYWVFNAMAEHRLNEHTRLQARRTTSRIVITTTRFIQRTLFQAPGDRR